MHVYVDQLYFCKSDFHLRDCNFNGKQFKGLYLFIIFISTFFVLKCGFTMVLITANVCTCWKIVT